MKLFSLMQTAYDNFDQSVRTYLAKTFNSLGMQYTHSQIFGVIFDGIRGVIQNMMFYIEDALTEQNIFKASRKNSIYSLAKLSGYEAFYGSSPCGNIIAKIKINAGLQNNSSGKLYIQHGTQISNKITGVKYSVVLPSEYYVIDVSKPLVSHSFNLVQGYFVKSNYTSKGYNLETIKLTCHELFDKNYLTIKVDGETWEQSACLYDMSPDGKEYVVNIGFDNTFDIMFGNNIHGKKLLEGQNITIEYLRHNGSQGNITPEEVYKFEFIDPLYDTNGQVVNGNEFISLTMVNCISGGVDSDSIDFIRNTIGMNSRSLVLASEDNFKLFFKRFSFIGYVNCWSENNSMIITATCLRNFAYDLKDPTDYFKINKRDMLLTLEQKLMISDTLDKSKKTFAGVTLNFNDPVIRRYAFICYVKSDNIFNQSLITEDIKKTLANYFINLPNNCQFIAKSDIIKKCLEDCEYIKALEIDIISELAEETYKNNFYEKYELRYMNGTYEYITKKVFYEKETIPGLDTYGNISLSSNLEVPCLQGGFRYYINKENNDKSEFINIETIQILFI